MNTLIQQTEACMQHRDRERERERESRESGERATAVIWIGKDIMDGVVGDATDL